MKELKTLPTWATELGFALDRARTVIRARADLKLLGVRYGAARVFTRAEAERIAIAVTERVGKRTAEPVTA